MLHSHSQIQYFLRSQHIYFDRVPEFLVEFHGRHHVEHNLRGQRGTIKSVSDLASLFVTHIHFIPQDGFISLRYAQVDGFVVRLDKLHFFERLRVLRTQNIEDLYLKRAISFDTQFYSVQRESSPIRRRTSSIARSPRDCSLCGRANKFASPETHATAFPPELFRESRCLR